MSTKDVSTAVSELKQAVLANPQLAALVKEVRTPEELGRLWSNAGFREVHDRLIKGLSLEDVRAYLAEPLGDAELDQVTGGMAAMNMQFIKDMSPSAVYTTALFRALSS